MQPLGDLFKLFVKDRRYLKNVSRRTLTNYTSAWNAFGPHLKDIAEETAVKPAVTEAIIQIQKEFRKRVHTKRPISDYSINNYLTVVNAILNWCHEENHMDRLIRFKKLKTLHKVRSILTDEEVEAFIKFKPSGANQTRLKPMILTCLDCGLRLMEVRKLRDENIDLDNLLIKVQTGKGRKQRIIPFSNELAKTLYKYQKDNAKLMTDGFLFGTRGKKLYSARNISRDMVNLCKKLSLRNITFHQLRHTFGTNYLKRGGDVMMLRRIMGHTSIATTQIYEHMQTEDLQRGFNRLSGLNTRRLDED